MGCALSIDQDAAAAEKTAARLQNMEYWARMEFLSKVPLLQRLPAHLHPLVAAACRVQDFGRGDVVIKQGDNGDEFFVICQGEATVTLLDDSGATKKVTTLKAGDYFGEAALLRNDPRAATITADTKLSTLKIKRDKFRELGLNDKLQFANRRAVVAGGARLVKAKPPTPKTEQECKLITQALQDNENLPTLITMDEARLRALVDIMWREEVVAGVEIIKEGDMSADFFYVVQEGCFEVLVSPTDTPKTQKDDSTAKGDVKVNTLTTGDSFGELALLYFAPRAATVRAKEKSVVWVIDRQNFKTILMKVSEGKLRDYVRYLDGVGILQSLFAEEKLDVAKALVEMHFSQGDAVVQEGEPGSTFYILYDGEVNIEKDGRVLTTMSASVSRGTAQYFGEGALLDNETRAATVRVTSTTAKTLVLDRDSFNLLLGPLGEILRCQRTGDARQRRSVAARPGRSSPDQPRERIHREDLAKIGLLGAGGFGTVELYEHRVSRETYAMKSLSKGFIVRTGTQDAVMQEKNILVMTNSDFVIKLYETYNESQSLCFLLEPALGGELYATYHRRGFHGSARHARYYTAGTILAFEHLHERRIVYRDLKPENLLLTAEGHLKLTDMGLAKFVIGKTFTTCGTPDYFAPELVKSIGHSNALDWWTLGVLVFELMAGHTPFESDCPMQTFAKVTKGIGRVAFPPPCSGPVGDLIRGLLRNEPSERLPMRPGGINSLRQHPWFEGLDWRLMADLRLEPPHRPVVKSKRDLANFSVRPEDLPKQLEYVDPRTGWDLSFASVDWESL